MCLLRQIVIDYEARQHFEGQAMRDDIAKCERLQDLGWRVLRVTKDDMYKRPLETIARVRKASAERGPAA